MLNGQFTHVYTERTHLLLHHQLTGIWLQVSGPHSIKSSSPTPNITGHFDNKLALSTMGHCCFPTQWEISTIGRLLAQRDNSIIGWPSGQWNITGFQTLRWLQHNRTSLAPITMRHSRIG